jgi:PKD repeat protein
VALQTHHLIELLVPQHAPLPIGTRYATTAGVHVGSHEHTHFEFKVGRKRQDRPQAADAPASIAWPIDFDAQSEAAQNDPEVLHLDPWVLFWQIFEDRKARQGELTAAIQPLAPARTGEPVTFSAARSGQGTSDSEFGYHWTSGDGGGATGPNPRYAFARPGLYPVTLVVDDGRQPATRTQHIAISGPPVAEPVLALAAFDEPSFRLRSAAVADVYGGPVTSLPYTLTFVARASRPVPNGKVVAVRNLGGGELAPASVTCRGGAGAPAWLKIQTTGDEDRQFVQVAVDATGMNAGAYRATLYVDCPGAVNSPQPLTVSLEVRRNAPAAEVTIDDRDAGFFATPYFWAGHRFSRCPPDRRGNGGFYLSNGDRAAAGEFARFTPDLQAGVYQVSFSDATPFRPDTAFDVRVRHAGGEATVRVRPENSRRIGRFEFHEGADGFVEIQAAGSRGLVIADAVRFERG